MKQFKLAALVFVTSSLFTSIAFAAYKGEEVSVSAPHNWTGFYAGLNAGAVKHTMTITDNQATSFNATIQQAAQPQLTGGFQAGYRRQLDLAKESGVYGLEFSANFSNATYSKEYGSPFALYQLGTKNALKDVCLLQLIGGIAADKTLLFLAAGLSWTDITGNITNEVTIPFFNTVNLNNTAFGTALGGGIEYAFTDKVSLRLKVDVITPYTFTTSDNLGDNFQVTNDIVQTTLGVNYKFG